MSITNATIADIRQVDEEGFVGFHFVVAIDCNGDRFAIVADGEIEGSTSNFIVIISIRGSIIYGGVLNGFDRSRAGTGNREGEIGAT